MAEEEIEEEEEEKEADYSRYEVWRNKDFLTNWWTKIHMRKWANEVVNLPNFKKLFVESIKSINKDEIDDIEDFEIKARLSFDSIYMLRSYYNIKIESVVKKAMIIAALDGRVTIMDRDVMKAIHGLDKEIDYFVDAKLGCDNLLTMVYKDMLENKKEEE